MGYPNKEQISKLWIRMKSYINARLESIDASVDLAIDNAIANAGHMEMELLWENASPTSEFAEQTITLDLSNYDFVMVKARRTTGTAHCVSQLFKVGEIGYMNVAEAYVSGSNIRAVAVARAITINGNEITIGNGLFTMYQSQSAAPDCLIPVAIYGIKGVK